MRDQPFKKYFPADKAKQKESYRYPTYQHYYESKVSRLNVKLSPKNQVQLHSQKKQNQTETVSDVAAPGLIKQTSQSNLKTQLENLKLQVQRIMQKKRGILRSPVQKKHHQSSQKLEKEAIVDSPRKSDYEDNLSVNSEKLINEPLLQLRKTTENYDHEKYLQLENDLLKTELRNLKNKYNSKKKELNEKCGLLQKKVAFLSTSLYNSQQSLEAQIASLKQNLKNVQKEGARQLIIPTSDRVKSLTDLSPKKEANLGQDTQILQQKMKKLYDQLSLKNKLIYQKEEKIEQLQNDISKLKNQTSFGYQKSKSLQRQAEQLKKIYNATIQKLNEKQIRIQELQERLQNERGHKFIQNNNSLSIFEEKLKNLDEEYESKLKLNSSQIDQLLSQNKKNNQQKMILQQQLNFLKAQNEENVHRIQILTTKLKEQKINSQQIEEKYLKILERNEKKHEQILANINREYQTKVSVLSKKDQKSFKDESQKAYDKKIASSSEKIEGQQKQLRKWKLLYKQLKQKYEQHLKAQANRKNEDKQSYKHYRQYKHKVEISAHKLKLFQKQFQKYLAILTEKQNQLLQKQIQLRKLTNDRQLEKNVYTHQNQVLTQKCKNLEEKLSQQSQKYESQIKYRKELEDKIFTSGISEQSLKEMMERMKKRLLQQDQKFSKIIKQNKNKQSLNLKLKQQLREVMENLQKKILQQKGEQIKEIIQTYLKKELDSFKEWKKRSEEEHKLVQQSTQKLLKEIQQLKGVIIQKQEALNFCQKQLNIMRDSYNLKNIEVQQLIQEKERMLNQFNEQLQQTNQIRMCIQKIFQDEIMMKNQEITILRAEISAMNINTFQTKYYNNTFDDILKSNMEDNKKLRDDITKKTEEIFRLRDNYSTMRSQYQNLKAQIQINKLKMMSQKKNIEVNFQIETQNIKNELDMSQKKVISLQQKIKLLIEQNKKKDGFIQTYIVGKKLTPNDKDLVINFIKQYQITIGSNDIVNRLASQTKQIQKLSLYNHNLLKQISVLRQKLLAYQAIDQEGVSIFDLRASKYSLNSSEIKQELNEEINLQMQKNEKTSQTKLRKAQSLQQFVAIEHEF